MNNFAIFIGILSFTLVNSFFPYGRMSYKHLAEKAGSCSLQHVIRSFYMNLGDGAMNNFDSLRDGGNIFSGGVMYIGDGRAESKASRLNVVKNSRAYLFAPEPDPEGVDVPINGDPMNAKDANTKSKLMELPLMPFEAPLFPGSREFLFIYEMRFRSLMQGAELKKLIGRCFISEDDQVGSIGTLCRIVENRKLESGKGFYVIEGRKRFRIVSIKQRTPYIIALVDLDWEDEELSSREDLESVVSLWNSIYINLKIYLRVARLHLDFMRESAEIGGNALSVQASEISRLQREIDLIETRVANRLSEAGDKQKLAALREAIIAFRQMAESEAEDAVSLTKKKERLGGEEDEVEEEGEDEEELHGVFEDEEYEFLSPEVRDSKPLSSENLRALSDKEITERVTVFSHSVANLLSTDEYTLQQLLQSTCLLYRLKGLKACLDEALEDVEEAMRGSEIEQHIIDIRIQAKRDDDDDSDLMPPPEYEGVTLDSMLDEELLKKLDEKETILGDDTDSVVTNRESSDVIESRVYSIQQAEQSDEQDPEEEDDIWSANSVYAFQ